MYYSYVEIEYVATSFSPARTDLAVKLLNRAWLPSSLPSLIGAKIAQNRFLLTSSILSVASLILLMVGNSFTQTMLCTSLMARVMSLLD